MEFAKDPREIRCPLPGRLKIWEADVKACGPQLVECPGPFDVVTQILLDGPASIYFEERSSNRSSAFAAYMNAYLLLLRRIRELTLRRALAEGFVARSVLLAVTSAAPAVLESLSKATHTLCSHVQSVQTPDCIIE